MWQQQRVFRLDQGRVRREVDGRRNHSQNPPSLETSPWIHHSRLRIFHAYLFRTAISSDTAVRLLHVRHGCGISISIGASAVDDGFAGASVSGSGGAGEVDAVHE